MHRCGGSAARTRLRSRRWPPTLANTASICARWTSMCGLRPRPRWRSSESSVSTADSTFWSRMPGTWSGDRARLSPPEQLAELYDINVLGTQRVNRVALPHMRTARQGLIIWIGSSSSAAGWACRPCSAPISPPKRLWMRWRFAMPASWPRSASRPRSWFRVPLPKAPIISRMPARQATWRARPSTRRGLPERFAERMKDALAATVPEEADPAAVAAACGRYRWRPLWQATVPCGHRPRPTTVRAVSYTVIDRGARAVSAAASASGSS